MKFSRTELIVYAVIFVIIVVGVSTYATGILNPYTDVTVRLVPLSSTQSLYPYQISRFRVLVNNTGRASISNLVVATYLNGSALNATFSFNLPPGTGAEYNFSYIYTSPGRYDFQAIADPGRLFDIQNRSEATGSYEVNVNSPALPDVYTSVPNSNISSSQNFGVSQVGLDSALFIATQFGGEQLFSRMVDSNTTAVLNIFKALSPYIATVKGAYTSYDNSSSSYVAWIEGPINASIVGEVLSSYGISPATTSAKGVSMLYTKLNSTASLCTLSSGGWTRLIEYTNSSVTSQTCASLASSTYNSTETQKFVNELKADPKLVAYSGNFFFGNSVTIGSELIDYSNTIARMNITENRYGIFSGYVAKNPVPFNVSSLNLTCPGVIYTNNSTSICSYGISPINQNGSVKYLLLNAAEVKSNYTAILYSLVNSSTVPSIEESSPLLFKFINISGNSAIWTSSFRASCAFSNTIVSLPCSISNYSLQSGNTTIKIRNQHKNPLKLNSIACFLPGYELNKSINATIAPGGNATIVAKCSGYLSGVSEEITYLTQLNYTLNGTTMIVDGSLTAPTS